MKIFWILLRKKNQTTAFLPVKSAQQPSAVECPSGSVVAGGESLAGDGGLLETQMNAQKQTSAQNKLR